MDDQRAALREWVLQANGKITAADLRDDTPLLEQRVISSLQVADLILFLEEQRQRPVDVSTLTSGALRSIDSMCATFLGELDR